MHFLCEKSLQTRPVDQVRFSPFASLFKLECKFQLIDLCETKNKFNLNLFWLLTTENMLERLIFHWQTNFDTDCVTFFYNKCYWFYSTSQWQDWKHNSQNKQFEASGSVLNRMCKFALDKKKWNLPEWL